MDESDLPAMAGMSIVAAFLALMLMLLIGGSGTTIHNTLTVPVGATTSGQRIGTIVVDRPWQFVKVRARFENVSNRWVDLDYSLVDRRTQQSHDAYGLLELYEGTDSDGHWTEGDHQTTTLIGRVPRGTYDLYVDTEAHGWPSDPVASTAPLTAPANPWAPSPGTGSSGSWGTSPASPVETISVSFGAWSGAMPWGNWWTTLALLLTLPIAMIWWRHRDR